DVLITRQAMPAGHANNLSHLCIRALNRTAHAVTTGCVISRLDAITCTKHNPGRACSKIAPPKRTGVNEMHPYRYTHLWTIVALLALSLSAMPAFAQETDATAEQALADCPVAAYIMGVRYQQKSAEIKALQLQSYNL